MKDEPLENNIVTLFERGWPVRKLSQEFGISRGRVKRILQRNEYKRKTGKQYRSSPGKQGSKVDPYKEYISDLLETFDKTPPTNQRIFELIKEKGYEGGITILSNYLQGIRGKHKKEPILCIETGPGQRGAHDWSEYYIEFTETGQQEKVTFFSFILCYSRRQYIEIVEDKTQTTLLKILINTFLYFDGVVKEIKSDNQKACVDRWESGKPIFNKKFLEFATHYRFRPLTITPGKPRENLKIERPFYYLETNFLNARKFFNKQELKQQLLDWLQTRNDQRIHRTTRQKPIDLYKEELPYLQPLPLKQFDTSRIEYRVVNNESCIEWSGYYYVVPKQYLLEACPVRVSDTEIVIYSPGCEEVKRYPLAEKGRKDRYIGRARQQHSVKVYLNAKEVTQRLGSLSPVMDEYISQVQRHKPKNSYLHHLRAVLSLKVNYHVDDIVMAVRRALKHKVYESGAIENFLSLNAEKKNEVKLLTSAKTTNRNE
jgi:transposase